MSSLVSVCVLLGVGASAPDAPQWQADYGKALAETRSSDQRPLIVVIDNPSEAGQAVPAELLEDGESLSAYELCHVDASTKYGKSVAEVFGAKTLPYVAIIDKTGTRVLNRHAGQMTADTWSNKLAQYEDGKGPIKVTANKPVASTSTTPAASYPSYGSYPIYNSPVSNCPNCQRGF